MQQTVDNPGADVVDNASTSEQPATDLNGTDTTSGQVSGGTPTEEIFKGIDPNTLTPKEKATYNSMLSDYRAKTAGLKETIKSESAKAAAVAAEAYKSKAELYEQIASQEEFVKQWNEYVQKTQAQTGAPPQEGDPVLSEMKQQLQEMNQKIQMSELSKVTDSFADAIDEKGVKIHPDFDALNSIVIGKVHNGKSAEEYSLLRASIELAPGGNPQEKLVNGYKMAKATYDSIFEAGKKAGLGRLQTKVLNGSLPPSNSGSEALQVTDKKPKTAHEAFALAKRGIVVSRD